MQHVLVAVDGSAGSRRALELARDLARGAGAKLTLLHVVAAAPVSSSVMAALGLDRDELRQAQLRDAYALLESVSAEVGVPDAERAVVIGDAAETICAEAEEAGADVIVLGSHGHGRYPSVTLGGTGARVACLSSRSVLLVR